MKTSNTFPSHSYESYAAWTCSLSRRLALHEGGRKKKQKKGGRGFKYQIILKTDPMYDREPHYKVNYANGHTAYCRTEMSILL